MNSQQEIIEKKFNKSQDALVLQQSDLSLKSISDMVASKAIDINPKYQRRKRWDDKKESDLIESFILNTPRLRSISQVPTGCHVISSVLSSS